MLKAIASLMLAAAVAFTCLAQETPKSKPASTSKPSSGPTTKVMPKVEKPAAK